MSEGLATYKRLKQYLGRQGRTLTEYAASLGTGIPNLARAITTYAGTDRLPPNPITRKILETVEADLRGDKRPESAHQDEPS